MNVLVETEDLSVISIKHNWCTHKLVYVFHVLNVLTASAGSDISLPKYTALIFSKCLIPPKPRNVVKVTEGGISRLSSVSTTTVQGFTLVILIGLVQFRSFGKLGELFSRDSRPLFPAVGRNEQFWHRQGRPFFDFVLLAFLLPATASPTLQGARNFLFLF